ncbi:hypothetical protein LINPERHAP1_LOCUS8825 [Linum perenne]
MERKILIFGRESYGGASSLGGYTRLRNANFGASRHDLLGY